MANETYRITVRSPLLRTGLELSTCVSKSYVVEAVTELMKLAREIAELLRVLSDEV